MTNVAQPSVHRRVFTSTAIVMGGILLSRVLGFFREWTVAHQVGSNAMTDAYYAAFTLPGLAGTTSLMALLCSFRFFPKQRRT